MVRVVIHVDAMNVTQKKVPVYGIKSRWDGSIYIGLVKQ